MRSTTRKTDASPGNGQRRQDVQGLRAFAVISVLLVHAGLPVPGGFVGVDIFFVISGFVITAMLHREYAGSGGVRLTRFYWRRFRRLMPALALVVAFTLIGSALVLSPLGVQQNSAMTAVGVMALVGNLVIARTTGDYFDAPASTNPLLHTWSLSVEEQFYLVFPVLIMLAWHAERRYRRVGLPVVVVCLVLLGSFALALLGPNTLRPTSSVILAVQNVALGFYSPLPRAWEFAVGAALALLVSRWSIRATHAHIASLAGAAMCVASLWVITPDTTFPGPWTVLPVLGAALVILGGARPTPVNRALSHPRVAQVGDLSYSLYLWHWPFVVFALAIWPSTWWVAVIATCASFVPAILSFRWVEEPLRTAEFVTRGRALAAVTVTVGTPMLLASALFFTAESGYWSPRIQMFQAATRTAHAGEQAGCDRFTPLDDAKAQRCTWNRTAEGPPIYLIGDSNADQFSEAAIGAGLASHSPIVIATTSNCPFVLGQVIRDEASPAALERCRLQVEGTYSHLLEAEPGSIFIANADRYWWDDTRSFGIDGKGVTNNPSVKLSYLEESLTTMVSQLSNRGHRVVLVHTIPGRSGEFAWDPADCALGDLMDTDQGCDVVMPRSRSDPRQAGARTILDRVGHSTATGTVDPWPEMCPDGECGIVADTFVRYMDGGHISVQQSEALADAFLEGLKAHR